MKQVTYNNSTQFAPSGLGPRLRSAAGAGRYKMNKIQDEIKTLFESHDFIPDKSSLVAMDGYDELEKKDAIKFFSGKNYGQLLSHLQKGEPHYLEEWTVLKLDAIIHYAPAYFYYLLENLEHEEPDEEHARFEYFSEDIQNSAKEFISELGKYTN